MRTASIFLLSFLLVGSVLAQKAPGRQGSFALTNARIVPVSSAPIDNGTLIIRADTIAALGADVSLPSDVEVIDVSGLTIYPGMIDGGLGSGWSRWGR